jgi:hypothetical protein
MLLERHRRDEVNGFFYQAFTSASIELKQKAVEAEGSAFALF